MPPILAARLGATGLGQFTKDTNRLVVDFSNLWYWDSSGVIRLFKSAPDVETALNAWD